MRLVTYVFLPIVGFLLGWNLSLKNQHQESPITPSSFTEEGVPELFENQAPLEYRRTDPKSVDMDLFWETWGVMEANFLYKDKIKAQEQVYGAVRGMVNSLKDPYTNFLDPTETHEFEESINGEFQGIGAEIGLRKERLTVITPLKGSPAELAGLRSGDQIYQINGESTVELSLEEAVRKIRGPKGEKVTLSVIRESEHKPVDIVIVRDNIIVDTVEWKREGDIVVLSINSFSNNLLKEFTSALSEILLDPPKGMVLDLRNNPGGLLPDCVKMAKEFMPDKVIVKTKGLHFGETGDLRSGSGGALENVPLVVLINEGSASASEIFAGAVQDNRRGVVVGKKSYGKGSVQRIIPLSDGSSLKVTIMEWLTPDGRSIHEKGIQPHEVIERTFEDVENGIDPQMDRAIEILKDPEAYKAFLEGSIPVVSDLPAEAVGEGAEAVVEEE